MDLSAAIDRKRRLHSELDAIMNHGLTLPISIHIIAIELYRLDLYDPDKYYRSPVDISSIEIPIEGKLLMAQLSGDFELYALPSLMAFRSDLIGELNVIANFHQATLPLTCQLIQKVIKHLEDAIDQEKQAPSSREARVPLPPLQYGYMMYLHYCIDQAIASAIANDPNGIDVNMVLRHLENNPSIFVDDTVRKMVQQRCFEETLHLRSNPAPEELFKRRSRL